MDEAGGQVLFRRMPHPGMELLDHASRIGVRLKCSATLKPVSRHPTPSCPSGRSSHGASRMTSRTPLSSRARTSPPRVLPPNTPPIQYIHNIVVPLNAPTDELNLATTTNSQAFNGLRVRSTTRSAQKSKRPSLVTTNTRASTSRCQTSTSVFTELRDNSTMPSDAGSDHDPDHWNKSEQGLRYSSEQDQVNHSRTRKRTSEACSTAGFSDDPFEIRPHRVDRMYYMSGSILPLRNKYNVDDSELNQLKEMAKARRQAKQYGRGLSGRRDDLTYTTALNSSEVPRQPPPSSMGDAETVVDGLLAEDSVINDTRTVNNDDGQPDPDEGIVQDTAPCSGDVELADMSDSAREQLPTPQCEQHRDSELGEQEPDDILPGEPEDGLPGEPGAGRNEDEEASLATQRDTASMPALDSSRHNGSVLTVSGTDVSTARSEPWAGALLQGQLDPETYRSQDTIRADSTVDQSAEPGEERAESVINQSEEPVEKKAGSVISQSEESNDDLQTDQSETGPVEVAPMETKVENKIELIKETEPVKLSSQPLVSGGKKQIPESPRLLTPAKSEEKCPSEEVKPCDHSNAEAPGKQPISGCQGAIEDVCPSSRAPNNANVKTNQKPKERPLSPCKGH